jgi:hypothetical protein
MRRVALHFASAEISARLAYLVTTVSVATIGQSRLQVSQTLRLVLQYLDLGIGIKDELVHLLAKRVVLFGQAFGEMFLVYGLLHRLIVVESQSSARTLHDDCRAETAQHTGFVVFGRIKTSDHDIIRVWKSVATSGAGSVCLLRARQSRNIGALCAEDMAFARQHTGDKT